jgi:hypothetical protein
LIEGLGATDDSASSFAELLALLVDIQPFADQEDRRK